MGTDSNKKARERFCSHAYVHEEIKSCFFVERAFFLEHFLIAEVDAYWHETNVYWHKADACRHKAEVY